MGPDTRSLQLFLILSLTFLVGSCARSFNPDIERGSGYQFEQGHPEMRLSAIGFLDEEDQAQINVAADVVYGSLVYRTEEDKQTARFAVEIQILDKENPENIIKSERFEMKVEEEDSDITSSQDVFTFEKRLSVDPGEYDINVTITDQNSDKRTTRSSSTFIPDPSDEIANLTNIRLLGKENGERNDSWVPITTYDVPSKIDSLKFVFQVTNNDSEEPMTIDSELLKFRSDTSHARPMHYNNYSPSNISYRGIEYDEQETIQSSQRELTQSGSVLIEFVFPNQQRGNYRFDVRTDKGEEESEELFKARDFSVKSPNYPSLKTPRELAAPLVYLMGDKEHERMMEISDPDSLKQEIDRFWLKNVRNKSQARSVIELYYQRVEEANKQFSSFKEGWKTDTGMIYILFGPPWYVETSLDRMTWSYAYNRNDPEYNYNFRKSKMRSEFYPFDNYILQRNQFYFNIQYQQVQLWLTGQILTRSI